MKFLTLLFIALMTSSLAKAMECQSQETLQQVEKLDQSYEKIIDRIAGYNELLRAGQMTEFLAQLNTEQALGQLISIRAEANELLRICNNAPRVLDKSIRMEAFNEAAKEKKILEEIRAEAKVK